jgi:pimeloyl-ACP methyl ester carboxylesterase
MLFGHLDRLPPLKPGQRIARLSEDVNVKHQTILQALRDLPSSPFGMTAAHRRPAGDPGFQFVDTPDGQIFIRCFGDKSKPAVILLHDAPGSGLMLVEMARALAADHYVIVPDLPANGESDAPSPDRSVLAASIRGLSLIADDLGLERFILAGIGCGASVAAAAAQQPDPRLRAILLEDVPARSEATAEAIAPPIPLTPEGAHWVQAWLTVRDSQIYKPWFDGRVAAQRRIQGNFDAKWLHDQTFALMKSRASYHRLPREAYRFDTAAAITNAQVPVMLAPDGGLAALISST